MSYSETPMLNGWQKLGCAAYFLVMAFVCFIGLTIWMFDGWDEPPMPRLASVLLFPALPLIAIAGGVALLKFFVRDKE